MAIVVLKSWMSPVYRKWLHRCIDKYIYGIKVGELKNYPKREINLNRWKLDKFYLIYSTELDEYRILVTVKSENGNMHTYEYFGKPGLEKFREIDYYEKKRTSFNREAYLF